MLCSTTCPNRCTRAGSRGGRWVAFVRRKLMAEVEGVRLLGGQLGQRMSAGDDAHRDPVRVGQVDGDAADASGSAAGLRAGRVGEPLDVGVLRGERECRRTATAAPRRMSTHGDACVGSAQMQFVGGVQHSVEPEGPGEGLGADQIRLLELQPGEVADLDHGVAERPGCSPRSAPCSLCRSLWASAWTVTMLSSL